MSLAISVIMPCFNCAQYIEQALHSVFEQQGGFSIQLLIADGGSRDGTPELLAKLERDAAKAHVAMEWISEPDNGQSDALNKLLPKITGEVVTWLNGDDWYAPGAFAAVAETFEDQHVDIVLGNCIQMGEQGPLQGVPERSFVNNPKRLTPFTGGEEWVLVTPEVFFRRSLIDQFTYDLCLNYFMDVGLWMHLFLQGPKIVKLEQTLAFFRSHEECKTIRAWSNYLPELLVEDHILFVTHRERMDIGYSEDRFRKLMCHFFSNWQRLGVFEERIGKLEALVNECRRFSQKDREWFATLLRTALDSFQKAQP